MERWDSLDESREEQDERKLRRKQASATDKWKPRHCTTKEVGQEAGFGTQSNPSPGNRLGLNPDFAPSLPNHDRKVRFGAESHYVAGNLHLKRLCSVCSLCASACGVGLLEVSQGGLGLNLSSTIAMIRFV